MKGFIKENINSETCLILGALQKESELEKNIPQVNPSVDCI